MDSPLVREMHTCPVCLGPKGKHLLLCWPCHHKEKLENDGCYSEKAERAIVHLHEIMTRLTATS